MIFPSKLLLILAVSYSSARFGQENKCRDVIAAVTGGPSGVAETLAGQSIGIPPSKYPAHKLASLLAKANPCDKLDWADKVFQQLGQSSAAEKAALCLVHAEKKLQQLSSESSGFLSKH